MVHAVFLDYIVRFLIIFAIITGLIGNILQFRIYSKKSLKKYSFTFYFRITSIVDLFITLHLIKLYLDVQFNYRLYEQSNFLCKFVTYSIYAAGAISAWTLVAMSLDRLVTIVFPRKFLFLFKKNYQVIILVLIFALNGAYYSFLFVDLNILNANLTIYENKSTILRYCNLNEHMKMHWLDLANAAVVPFTLMIMINIIILRYIFKSRKKINICPNARLSRRDRKFSITSISLNLIFLLLNAPTNIYSIVHEYQKIDVHLHKLLDTTFLLMFYSNYALNFYLQILVNSILRNEIVKMLSPNRTSQSTGNSNLRMTNQSDLRNSAVT